MKLISVFCVLAMYLGLAWAVTCDVGADDTTITMDCPGTDKCVWTSASVNGQTVIGKICFNQMDWSLYPAISPRLGCQEFSGAGMTAKICVCTGYRCNQNDPSTNTATSSTTMSSTTSGSSYVYATSTSTLFALVIAF